ncbi:baseplate J/gp47 family protein [Brevibacillus sp. AG]|uniref:baseplate J/gp47 family protein n=1 Tax=Brevibacillus sp. AG TaxID=3020891 RepID=UPI00232E3C43|nr:baseplate J/gp47 family protein [Brevibacillus sp. AG]MDC0761703.1 baseplate J/gp47 family protein [Brevibacillus sp. AG]
MLDEKGFKRKRFADLFAEMEAKAKEAFGEKVNTSDRSPLGIILRMFAWFLSKLWQSTEDVYNSAYPNTAQGASLYRLGPYAGIRRLTAGKAVGVLSLTGTPNYTEVSGFKVSDGRIVFETIEPVALGSDGKGTAKIRAMEAGSMGNLPAGTITTVVNPNGDITSVTNLLPTTRGRDLETEREFRDRFSISTEGRGKGTIPAIRKALMEVPGVRAAAVVENYTNVTDSAGRPSKSIEAYVLGGDKYDIGQTIFENKGGGIEPYGTQTVTVKDDAGVSHIMRFSYATEVYIHLRITVSTLNNFLANGPALIKTEAIKYLGGEDEDGTIYTGLNMGMNVVHSALVSLRTRVEGIEDLKVEMSKDGISWTQENIEIAPYEVAQTSHDKISVVIQS